MNREQLIYLYEFILKQTGELYLMPSGFWNKSFKSYEERLTEEINRLLIKYNCIPIN